MIVLVDTMLGLLLAVSVQLFVICLVSYKRSGVKLLALSCYFLAASAAFDVAVLIMGHATDWLADVDGIFIIASGTAILVVAVMAGRGRGRLAEGSA